MARNSFLKNSQGSAAVEFAIIFPVLFLLLSGVVNFGLILGNQNHLNAVASAGLLYAFGNSSSPSAVTTAMQNATNMTPLTLTATKVCKCYPSTNNPSGAPTAGACTSSCAGVLGSYITVTAQSQLNLIGLDFVLTNPFVTNVQGTIRTN
ncbi:MAG: pilus assembly protein [Proteobacteria bacterium]|nr:pilus assembly protein [Pseudomonadota bacterium]